MAGVAPAGSPEALRYTRVAVWLHWLIAAFVLVNLAIGLLHDELAKPLAQAAMSLHKSIGFSVLALAAVRLAWRLAHRPPPYDPIMKRWEKILASVSHWAFYILLFALPVTGWLISSAGGRPTSWFGLFQIGSLPIEQDQVARAIYHERHEMFGWLMIALIVLHVAAALKHQLQGHRHLFGRMAPWFYREA